MDNNEKTQDSNSNLQEHVANIPFHSYDGDEPYIFVSYAHKDASKVFPEIKRFHDDGYNIWYDQGISPGNEWPEEIAESLEGCSLFIVFITASSVDSINVRNEINYALSTKKPFLAIYLEKTELTGGVKLRIASLQGILKYTTTEEEYIWKYRKAFKQHGFEKKEKSSENNQKNLSCEEKEEKTHEKVEDTIQSTVTTTTEVTQNFTYLDQLIHSGQKEIKLEYDIILEEAEEEKYPEGIQIDVDDLIIDGKGHTIDAQQKTRIVQNTGKNITIKNITLKNGNVEKSGGAILNLQDGKISIEDSTLAYNVARWGGAIDNMGEIKISNSKLKDNNAKDNGGAIFNQEEGNITIQYSELCGNIATEAAGAITNRGNLTLTGSTLKDNKASEDGGAIDNMGEIISTKSIISNNKAEKGGAILNAYCGIILFLKNTFTNNKANNGGVIFNYTQGKITLKDSSLTNNIATETGGAIWTTNKETIKLDNCKFENNILNDIYSEEDN